MQQHSEVNNMLCICGQWLLAKDESLTLSDLSELAAS